MSLLKIVPIVDVSPDKYGTIMCLDVGIKKTGIATSNIEQTIAFPVSVLRMEENTPEFICKIINERQISYIVCGFPFAYEELDSAKFIVQFVKNLLQILDIEVVFWDEFGSSKTIRESYYSGRQKFKKRIYETYDAKSASLILQDFLDFQRL